VTKPAGEHQPKTVHALPIAGKAPGVVWHDGRFDLVWAEDERLAGGVFRLRLHDGGRRYDLTNRGLALTSSEIVNVADMHGCAGQRLLRCYRSDAPALRICWQADRCPDVNFILISLSLTNLGREPLYLDELIPWAIAAPTGKIILPGLRNHWNAFLDGWQSWSFSGSVAEFQRQPRSHWQRFTRPIFEDVGVAYPSSKGAFLSHGVTVLSSRVNPAATLVAGFVRQFRHFGIVTLQRHPDGPPTMALRALGDGVPLRPGASWQCEPAYLEIFRGSRREPLAQFADLAGRLGGARSLHAAVPVGWGSWYERKKAITEEDIVRNLGAVVQLATDAPLNLVQIDDGYEQQVGDWQANEKFPHGLAWLAEQIQAAGKTPGLWLAPFIVHPQAALVQAHPDWLLRNEKGKPVSAGFLWGRFAYALDVTHPDVQAWVLALLKQLVQFGYRFLKLDYLYAAALPGKHQRPGSTRAKIAHEAYLKLRQAAGEDVFLLGCGVPLGPAVGVFDAVRIGPDMAPHWLPRQYGLVFPFLSEREMPSARNAMRNVLTRSVYHRRLWLNDPDNLILRRHDSDLTDEEVRAQLTLVGLSGGLVLAGDDLTRLRKTRQAFLATLLPPQPERGVPLELLNHEMPMLYALHLQRPWGPGHRLALFNWDDEKRTHTLELGPLGLDWQRPYHLFEFWSGQYHLVDKGYVILNNLPPHSARLFAIQPVTEMPQLLATTFHLSMGGEVDGWLPTENGVELHITLGRKAQGALIMACPADCRPAGRQAGLPLTVEPVAAGIYAVSCAIDGEGTVQLQWA